MYPKQIYKFQSSRFQLIDQDRKILDLIISFINEIEFLYS